MVVAASVNTPYREVVLADSPVYYWTFDNFDGVAAINLGSAGAVGNNELSNPGGVTFPAGSETAGGYSLGNAANFNGTSDVLTSPVAGLTGGAFTKYVVEFWMNCPDGATDQYMFYNGENRPSVIVGFNDNVLEMFTYNGFTSLRTGGDGPNTTDGDWHHVVIGLDSATTHIFYVDGQLHSNQSEATYSWLAAQQVLVGGTDVGSYYTGQLDEIAVYDVGGGDLATFVANIAAHYVSGPPKGTVITIN